MKVDITSAIAGVVIGAAALVTAVVGGFPQEQRMLLGCAGVLMFAVCAVLGVAARHKADRS